MSAPTKNLLPDLEPEQYNALKDSIKEHGFWPEFPILVDKKGNIIDGWNRQKIADELGIEAPTRVIDGDLSEWDLTVRAIKANTHRRHLTPAARREMLKKLKGLLDAELKRQGAEAKKAGAQRGGRARSVSGETKAGRARSAAADATIAKFDEPVVAGAPPAKKVDRIGTLADVIGASRATVARDEAMLKRIEAIEEAAEQQGRDDVARMLNKPRPNLDELERAVGLRDPLPEPEKDEDRDGWIRNLALALVNIQPRMSDDEADLLLDETPNAATLIIQLRQITKVVAERKQARK